LGVVTNPRSKVESVVSIEDISEPEAGLKPGDGGQVQTYFDVGVVSRQYGNAYRKHRVTLVSQLVAVRDTS
jgi:hypothetical protein